MRPSFLIPLLFPALALAGPVRLPGPEGALEAERIAVAGAAHALVIVPGSGPTDRDGNAPGMGLASNSYRLLAEGLAQRGIASLRIDKRGLFGSAAALADPENVTVAAYAGDVAAWVADAATLAPCVWVAGHSEGGLVALAMATAASPEALCGLILLATPGRPVGRILVDQLAASPANAPLMPEIAAIVAGLESGLAPDPDSLSPDLRLLFRPGILGYMMDLFAQDPAQLARRWRGLR